MVKNCVREDSGFGVCLITDGSETSDQNLQHARIGTLARITDWYTHDDGLLGISASGSARFISGATYTIDSGLVMGEVNWLPEPVPARVPEAYSLLSQILGRFMEKVSGFYKDFEPDCLDDATYVGYRLSELLPLGGDEKQMLLEMEDPIQRLQKLQEAMPRFQAP